MAGAKKAEKLVSVNETKVQELEDEMVGVLVHHN